MIYYKDFKFPDEVPVVKSSQGTFINVPCSFDIETTSFYHNEEFVEEILPHFQYHMDIAGNYMYRVNEKTGATIDSCNSGAEALSLTEKNNYDIVDAMCIEMKKVRYTDELQVLIDKLAMEILQLEKDEAIDTIHKIKEFVGE